MYLKLYFVTDRVQALFHYFSLLEGFYQKVAKVELIYESTTIELI